MATYTYNLTCTQNAFASYQNQSANYSSVATFDFYHNDQAFWMFEQIPQSYQKKKILGLFLNLCFQFPTEGSLISGRFYPLKKGFSENNVSYLNKPVLGQWLGEYFINEGKAGVYWRELQIPNNGTNFSDTLNYGLGMDSRIWEIWEGGNPALTFYSRKSSNKPYIKISAIDYAPEIISASPSSGYVNPKTDSTFTWNFKKNESPTPISQSSAKFRWRQAGASSYTEISINGANQEITIPANTFSGGQIEWQVVVTSDDNITGEPSKWYSLTTIDSEASAQTVSPVDVMVDGGQPIEFKWKHIINTGSPQSKFDLEYSDDNGLTWKLLKSEKTADTFTVIPADTLPAGNLLWRVRTYNSDEQPGEYSASASFVVRAAPPVPTISSVTAEARPVVRWQAVGQQAYEVDVLDAAGKQVYTTDETAGTDKEQKIMEYLDAGTYTVRVRVWNIYGIASPWADASVTVPELDKAPPELSGWASSGVARLTRIAGDYLFYYLLRDGKPIAKLSAGQTEYLDYTVLGQHQYVLRGVTAQDQFKDSAAVRLNVRVPYAMLAPADDPGNWVELVYRRGGEPTRAENLTITGQAVFAAGRTLPFFESNGQRTKDWSFNYSFRTLEEYQALVDLVQQGKTVLYRGKDGSRCWVALTGIQTSADYLSRDYTLTAVEVDRVETIEYD